MQHCKNYLGVLNAFELHLIPAASMGFPFSRKEEKRVTILGIFIMQAEFIKSAVKEMNATSLTV